MHPSRGIALSLGAFYTLLGLAGFLVTGFDNFAGVGQETLLGLELNPLQNVVHVGIGLIGLGTTAAPSSARGFGAFAVVALGALFAYGMLAVDNPDIDYLSLNQADNVLHLVTAVAGLVAAVWPAARPRREPSY
jgi:Domain of unknown function (DUF4383)